MSGYKDIWRDVLRLLVVNVFFDPQSFGGATIVAEQMAVRLSNDHGFDVSVVSSRLAEIPGLSTVKFVNKFGFVSYNVGLQVSEQYDYVHKYLNLEFAKCFRDILDDVEPDVVHVHCVQQIGAAFFDVLKSSEVPFVVTVHDYWWNCDRQFMIKANGKYCFQEKIDLQICGTCNGSEQLVRLRFEYLMEQLSKANLVLTPSEYSRTMLTVNGLGEHKVKVNKNGVLPPSSGFSRLHKTAGQPVKFGFVGGPGPTKGWELIVKAFSEVDPNSYQLLVVDSGASIGKSWRNDLESIAQGISMEILPPYDQSEIDLVFGKFSVLLAPSTWRETFGLAVREALIRGLWVIASDAGGLAEDIVANKNGHKLSFPPTVEDLYDAISDVINNDRLTHISSTEITTTDKQSKQLSEYIRSIL